MASKNYILDSLYQDASRKNDTDLITYLHFYDRIKKGLQYSNKEESLQIFESATTYYENLGDHRYAASGHFLKGSTHFELQQYGEAFYHHAKALELFSKAGMNKIPEIGKYLHNMALSHYYFHNYQKVIDLMRMAITYPAYNQNLDIQRFNTLGLAYQHIEKHDSAAYFFQHANQVASTLKDSTWITLSNGNLGKVYSKEGRYEKALPLLMEDFWKNQKHNHHPLLARNAAVEVAAIWQAFGRQDSVIRYLKESVRLNTLVRNGEPKWRQQRDEKFYVLYYQVHHDFYKAIGNISTAYQYLDSLTHLTKAMDRRYNNMITQVAEDQLKIQQQQSDIALQLVDKARLKTRFMLGIGLLALMTILMGCLYIILRLRHTKVQLQAEKDRLLQEVAKEKMKIQITRANQELEEYVKRIQEKNKVIEEIQSQIIQIKKHTLEGSTVLEELTHQLAHTKLLTAEDWDTFRHRFNKAYGGKLDLLKTKYGELTPAEERIYVLEVMNVSTRQIAWMLGISPESVRKARYRLHKKISEVNCV